MFSFSDLKNNNLPVYVRVLKPKEVQASWAQQIALFVLTTVVCLSGVTIFSYLTHLYGLNPYRPLGLEIPPLFMLFVGGLFLLSLITLGFWLKEESSNNAISKQEAQKGLNYIFPQSNSLHVKDSAWDLAAAHRVVIDYPNRVTVYFRHPQQTLVLVDDGSGFSPQATEKDKIKAQPNTALFVYFTGADLPNTYTEKPDWRWNTLGISFFVFSTSFPFLFQALGMPLYWIGFLAIPLSYLLLRAGQREFQIQSLFNYADFLKQHKKTNKNLFKKLGTNAVE